MFYDMPQYEYPKARGEYGFPPILDTDEDGNDVVHPIVGLLKAGSKIESVEVGDDWTDDHEICCDVAVVIDGKKYGFSAWWLSRSGYKMVCQAEGGKASSIQELTEYILENEDE